MRDEVVVALGPWAPDVLEPLGIKLPLGDQARLSPPFPARAATPALTRPVLDADIGYCLAPMEQGHPPHHRRRIRGARRAADAGAVRPADAAAQALFPLGEPVEATPWMGSRPCFADFTAGDRPRARAGRPVARLSAMPIGA